jgi:hypothetical protein
MKARFGGEEAEEGKKKTGGRIERRKRGRIG